jgi:hypothetical protein
LTVPLHTQELEKRVKELERELRKIKDKGE